MVEQLIPYLALGDFIAECPTGAEGKSIVVLAAGAAQEAPAK
jgi:hypothetical protein